MVIELEASSSDWREAAFAANWLIWANFVAELAFINTVAGISDKSREGNPSGGWREPLGHVSCNPVRPFCGHVHALPPHHP
jgi:hypothetical protein